MTKVTKKLDTNKLTKDLLEHMYYVVKTEYWNAFARRKMDLLGAFDFLALREETILGVQCTSQVNVNARIQKLCSLESVKHWLKAGGKAVVIGWTDAENYSWTMLQIDSNGEVGKWV
jgi:hypothetical protein